ncbi:Secreted protein [Phytophthora palmivora]|uniref:Secreted protein n=1 Tax=Phytophthora palmivora TaxID=4796 RepID=A0A2P4Y8X1_9STRA|nr:Secreted protein [Phytophthora palmivora]
MNNRGAPDSARAPSSPSSRVNVAPSDSDPPAESPDVVDVTGGGEHWTATSARRTSDPPPLRASTRTSGKAVAGAASADARKGKKRLTRQQASAGGTTPKKSAREASKDSEADLEEKPAPPSAKKAKKTTSEATSAPTTDMQGPSGSRVKRGAGQGFNLASFMASFASSGAIAESAPTVERAVTPVVPPPSPTPDVQAELQALRDEVIRLRGFVAASSTTVDDGAVAVTATATAPNARDEPPPPEPRYLTNSSFPDGWKKAKGDHNPPQTHLLAASRMSRTFGSVLDMDLLEQWPEIVISPFGVVDKGNEDATSSGRTIHDLSFPEGSSINDCTDEDSITKSDYRYCDAVATEILRAKYNHPGAEIHVMACDVADALVIEISSPFGWTGSPGFYEIFGGAISHIHGSHTNTICPTGFFNYHWVDDHYSKY